MQEIYRTVARLTTTDLTVMITGESGTGKELVARALHDYGKRRAGPFVAINMAAIPRELIESELFGHERGAFTGALNRGIGRFEQAAGGTLFLDEIGDMPPEAQTRLLRVLQEGEFTTVGGRQPIKANVRIVAATHRDLRAADPPGAVPRGSVLPPERGADPPAAAARAAWRTSRCWRAISSTAPAPRGLPSQAAQPRGDGRGCKRHAWPGNVRELENLMRRLAALYPQETIGADAVAAELAEAVQPAGPDGQAHARPRWNRRSSATSRPSSPRTRTACRCATCTTACWPRSSGRCCAWRWRRRAATRSRPRRCSG